MKGNILRLDKYLTNLAAGSRSQVKEIIKKGRVKVNGEIIKKPEFHINEETDKIEMDGDLVDSDIDLFKEGIDIGEYRKLTDEEIESLYERN